MSKKFLTALKLVNVSTDPSGSAGELYFNTVQNILKYHDGTQWIGLTSGGISNLDGGFPSSTFEGVYPTDGGTP